MNEYRLLIGARGWQHSDWRGDFYPDDLPDDWELGFYSNEFRVVLVPSDTDLSSAQDWLEDSEEQMQFIFEIEVSDWDAAQARFEQVDIFCQAAGARCAGVLAIVAAPFDKGELLELFSAWMSRMPVCVDLNGDGNSTERKTLASALKEKDMGLCWDGVSEFSPTGNLVVTRLSTEKPGPKELRQVIETCLSASKDSKCVLILSASPPSIDSMRNAGVIQELL